MTSETADQEGTRRQMENESSRTQRGLDRERRARSASPPQTPPTSATSSSPGFSCKPHGPLFSSGSSLYRQQMNVGTGVAHRLLSTTPHDPGIHDQLIAGQELTALRHSLFLTRNDIKAANEELKHTRQLADDTKSQLMTLEFKKGTALKELERQNEDIQRKKTQTASLESELRAKRQEIQDATRSLEVAKEGCEEMRMIKEESLSVKTKLRSMEAVCLERDELLRQLEAAKEDLFKEQKQGRLQRAELQEELETLTAKLEELQSGWGTQHSEMVKMETVFRRMEREKNELIQEKSQEYEALKSAFREVTIESQQRLKNEITGLEHEIQELRVRVHDLQSDNSDKDILVEKLRVQVNDFEFVLAKERQDWHHVSSQQKKTLQQLKKETTVAVLQLKESMFLEKQKALENLKVQLEEEKRESGARNDVRLTQVLEGHSYELEAKNVELSHLQDTLRRMEIDKEMQLAQQVEASVSREVARVQEEKDWQLRQEKEENKKRTNEMLEQMEKEKQTNRELQAELASLRQELEEQRRQQREATKLKLLAVTRTKEQMKEQSSAEIEHIKFNLKQEKERETGQLQEKLLHYEKELSALRTQNEDIRERERKAVLALEQTERAVVIEINEECHKVSGILGIPPRTMYSSFPFENEGGGGRCQERVGRPAVTTALANLRACHEKLQSHVADLQQEVDSLRILVEAVTTEKEETIQNCRLEVEKQRTWDLEQLKEKLLKEHVTEMSNVIRECAESNNQLKTNSQYLQRYGDTALLEVLKAKDEELRSLQQSMTQWKNELEEKFNTQLQLHMAKEREKYQALQHHSTREHKRIHELQKGEIDRLEKELAKLTESHSHERDTTGYTASPPAPRPSSAAALTSLLSPPTSPVSPASLKSSQQYLQVRIQKLQEENAALRKQRLLTRSYLNWSTPNLAKPTPIRPISPLGRSRSPTRDPEVMHRLGNRMRQGEQEARQAEERAHLNQKIMNNKLEEVTKLQNTLISQNQELQELERAYNDLKKHHTSNRYCSPKRNLNTTL